MNSHIKQLIFSAILLAATSAQAIPNIWNSEFGQGISSNSIQNEQGDVFTINCDIGYSENGELTGVNFTLANGQDLSPSDSNTLELLIDGKAYWMPDSLGWRNGDNAWYSFREAIQGAAQFDVYVNQKKVASFAPSPQSTQTVLGDLSECEYRY
ncbi:hypothetical protein C7I36_06325 [Zobellella taiwanensis]|uniref:Uncharacterized protein n=1 Tax=Zobellella taiwanensis TaxID=347535 RepID=A0A2P7R4B9_9GAMM|nr:hypothetical protein [Zobellella taiwanensis]PSJ45073.1 hypothetical protein C7I36_06325 [Zobellella taiwanensis]